MVMTTWKSPGKNGVIKPWWRQ